MTYYSEHGQDKFLEEEVFAGRSGGVFVEAGALDGVLHSNTLFFERERGWTGLLIEPNPFAFAKLVENRSKCSHMSAALWKNYSDADFEVVEGGFYGWSGLKDGMLADGKTRIASIPHESKKSISVPTVPLTHALKDMPYKIDYLSLDLEGAEYAVLKAHDWDSHEIEVMTIEDHHGDPLLRQLMTNKGYRYVGRIASDDVWRLATACS